MTRRTALQTQYNGGVIGPLAQARSDLEKYSAGMESATNVFPIAAGPLVFRPGTLFLGQNLDSTKTSTLIPFRRSDSDVYVLEWGENELRFWRNRGIVLSTLDFADGGMDGSLGTDWIGSTSGTGNTTLSAGTLNFDTGASGASGAYQQLSYLGIREYTITGTVTGNNVTVKVGTSAGASDIASGSLAVGTGSTFAFTPSSAHTTFYVLFEISGTSLTATLDDVSLDNPEYVIDTPYTATDAAEIDYTQNGDFMITCRSSYSVPPYVLQRYDHDQWVLKEYELFDGPYEPINTEYILLTPGGINAGGSYSLTVTTNLLDASRDVGRLLRYRHLPANNWGYMTITAVASPTSGTVLIGQYGFPSGVGNSSDWRFGVFGPGTGYPGSVTQFEGRLVFGNIPTKTNGLWMSESLGIGANKTLFAPSDWSTSTVSDSNSITRELSADDISTIRWMSGGPSLAVGTDSGEWVVQASDNTQALGPANTRTVPGSSVGSAAFVRPLRINGQVIYVRNIGGGLSRFRFDFNLDSHVSDDMSALVPEYFEQNPIRQIVYAREPHSLVWGRLEDGRLACLTFVDNESVGGWSLHEISGGSADTWGDVESIAVIPDQNQDYHELWLQVKRTIDGNTERHIEVLTKPFLRGSIATEAVYMDAALTYSGVATTFVTGLDHLEGETVTILADGVSQGTKTVSSGAITLDEAAEEITVGLAYAGTMDTLNLDAVNALNGPSIMSIGGVFQVHASLFETGLVYFKRKDQADDQYVLFEPRTAPATMDTPITLLEGIYNLDIEMQWGRNKGVSVQFRSPYPGTLRGMMFEVEVNEGY